MKFPYQITHFWLPMGVALSLSQPVDASLNSNLTVEISGLNNQSGQVCLSLFASSRGFPNSKEDAVQTQCVKITNTPLQVTFDNLSPKTYAVAVFWDDNGDGELNRNFLGIPTEKFGFSSNPVIKTGPPKFGESAILVSGKNTKIQIQLRSLI
ncbi:conserved hypothetical protein [Rippkaea orientalis PCC 8801]|uniref:DUF2141 domain-containing protein n=1 Tax=Rippkaea orientalis (strain PCC 8801 / RF-1) TaxID=41431 RepID=B7K3C8_RIPO1|nr:DUF2141 domain-containing protein [Rippkaea orientalis]ACK64448.1 conserved hypothetical protein [Rippkaea orientalis PCC 8801]